MIVKGRVFLLACAALGLQGCETYYRAPAASADTAKVRFAASNATQRVLVTSYESKRCDLGKTGGIMGVIGGGGGVPADVGSAGNTLGMIGYSEASGIKPIERVIPAGKPFVFSLFKIAEAGPSTMGGVILERCELSLSFLPVAGSEYEVDFLEDGASCYAGVFQLKEGKSGSVEKIREPSVGETEKNCLHDAVMK